MVAQGGLFEIDKMQISILSISVGWWEGGTHVFANLGKALPIIHITHTYYLFLPVLPNKEHAPFKQISFTMGSNSTSSDEITFSGTSALYFPFSDDSF